MGHCKSCGTVILFGGLSEDGLKYCSEACLEQARVLQTAEEVPPDILSEEVARVHTGACPGCGGQGPIDLHTSHRVTSLVVMSSWRSHPRVSCRSCGVKAQAGSLVYCLVLGWWGFPWGLLMTPVQIARNIAGLAQSPNPEQPSEHLAAAVRVDLGARMHEARSQPDTRVVA